MLNDFAERRKYQRHNGTICKALMSEDGIRYSGIELSDVSAGGLKFITTHKYEINSKLYFDLTVFNMLSEFKMKFESHVLREEKYNDRYSYSVKFDKADKYNQIQLDEIIKSKDNVSNSIKTFSDDGIYTYLFIPKVRRTRLRKLR